MSNSVKLENPTIRVSSNEKVVIVTINADNAECFGFPIDIELGVSAAERISTRIMNNVALLRKEQTGT